MECFSYNKWKHVCHHWMYMCTLNLFTNLLMSCFHFRKKNTMVSRLKLQYCKIVLATSLVWFLLDVVLLMYYTDCATSAATDCNGHKVKDSKADSGSLLKRILPKGKSLRHFKHISYLKPLFKSFCYVLFKLCPLVCFYVVLCF